VRGRISHPVAECALTTINLFGVNPLLGVFSLMVLSTMIYNHEIHLLAIAADALADSSLRASK
jgi:hypothetical protein